MPAPCRIAAFLSLNTEHGRGVLRGIAQHFRRQPSVTVLKLSPPARYDAAAVKRLAVDGIIAKVVSRADERVLARLGIPVVNVSGQVATPRLVTVNSDDMQVGRLAGRHLFGKGYRRFAYCGSRRHLASQLRYRGFTGEVRLHGAGPVPWNDLPQGDQTEPYPEELRRKLVRWLRELPRPVGIFAFTDRVALEIDEVCHRAGLRVPEDVAILGVGNDLTRLEFAHVDISSIQLNTRRIGELAAEMLQARIAGEERELSGMLVSPTKIVTRRSTDHLAVDDEAVAQALDYMREHVGNVIYVDDVARASGVSRRVLELRFRRVLGASIYSEVQRLHLERATELMADPELSLGEIAFASGHEDARHLCLAFRRWLGTTPGEYRRRVLGGAVPSK